MITLAWDDIEELVGRLADRLPRDYDLILVITRGGMVPACLLSERLDLRNIVAAAAMFYTEGTADPDRTLAEPIFLEFPADPLLVGKRILIDLAVLHYKPGRSAVAERPDYYAETTDEWVVYPWDPVRARRPRGQAAGYPGRCAV